MVSIIIVNWNSGEQLFSCLSSLDCFENKEIVVVDNASFDGSEKSIEEMSGVTLIRSSQNLGFGKACNLGAKHAKAEYLLFLNPDAVVYPGTLDKVLSFMENSANKNVGVCGVQLIDESGDVSRSCTRFPSAIDSVRHAIGIDRLFPRLGHFMAYWSHDKTQEVDHVIGAFYFVRRRLFETLGGFDERFFVYLEDLDLSLRIRRAGWKIMYLADVQAFHAGGGTSNQVKAKRLFYSLRSRLLYAYKNFSALGAFSVLLATLIVEPFSRSAWAILRCSRSSLWETWSGYGMLWRWLPLWFLKGSTR